jgi:hypothetical protein
MSLFSLNTILYFILFTGIYANHRWKVDLGLDANELCKHNQHVEGEWIRADHSLRNESFPCISTSELSYIIYDITGTKGKYTPVGRGCECSQIRPAGYIEPYQWKPANCRLISWSGKHFCSLLNNRTMLFIGDSTVEQSSATLMNMITLDGGQCEDLVSYARSDYLYLERFGKEKKFDQNVLKFQPDIVITSVGPWLEDEGDLEGIFDFVNKFFQSKEAQSITKPIKYYWKTQHPGHVDCDKYTDPISWEFSQKNELPKRKSGFHWEVFPAFDDMMRKYVHEHSDKWGLIDMSPLYLRPDSHPHHMKHDCLHFCIPGPIHLLPVLMLQMLHNNEM